MNAPLKQQKDQQSSSDSDLISISEIFGPTIQGEGALIGCQTIFVRTAGCDYRCLWCDTAHAVLPEYEKEWQSLDAQTIFNEIERLSNLQPMWVTLSGGNPSIQELGELIKLGHNKGYKFSMETQGSISKPWFSLLDQITLSPKPPSSAMNFKQRLLDRCLQSCGDKTDVSLKFVIADNDDLVWAKSIADQYLDISCYIQPCNTQASLEGDLTKNADTTDKIDQQSQMIALIDATQTLNWHQVRILPQLHTWLWGDQKGV